MEFILSVDEMRRADKVAIEAYHIPGLILMENAGLKTAQCIARKYVPIAGKAIGVFCGKGNNGGDGFVIGRHLDRMGANITFWLTGKRKDIRGDAKVNMEIADKLKLPIHEIDDWNPKTKMYDYQILIDSLLGTGLKGDVQGIYAAIIKSLNNFSGPVVAVDTPSGLNCDTGEPLGLCVKADVTITMGNIKTGMLFYPGRNYLGELYIADLNVPDSVFEQIRPQKYVKRVTDYRKLLPDRPEDAYKNTFGKILVFAGSTGLTGAASLCSLAALRSGAGMVILGCPKSLNPIFEGNLTEVMTDPLPETDSGSVSAAAFDQVERSLKWCQVVALGPGLSTHQETRAFVHRVVKEQNRPLVIDADGLNCITDNTDLLKQYNNSVVLTPHIGELARMTGLNSKQIQENKEKIVRNYAKEWGVVLLLKGAPTLIGDTNGDIYFNLSGNAGMATAGSGDVLTGLIAGFLGQGLSALNAALLGTFVHGLAGDRAEKAIGQRGIIASDILDQVPETLKVLEKFDYDSIFDCYSELGTRLF